MRRRGRQFPFLVLAPAVVVLLGLVSALAIAAAGLSRLSRQSEDELSLRAELLAETLAARLRKTPEPDRNAALEHAHDTAGVELVLADRAGHPLSSAAAMRLAPAQISELLRGRSGEASSGDSRMRYFVADVDAAQLLVLLRIPDTPSGSGSLMTSLAALATILVGAAALVALALARDVHSDVRYVSSRIMEMAHEDASPAGKAVSVRSTDQVGLLTNAFNVLVDRFAAAEHVYRQDLAGALAFDRDRSAFLAALSHELRTPLNAILGFTEVLLSEVDGPLTAESRENMEMVRSGGEHLRDLIGDILDLSALESGELELSPRRVDVLAIAQEVAREARVTALAKGLSLGVSGESVEAWADPRRVRQILTNVVGNAVKFTSEGSVGVNVHKRLSMAVIVVSDTGPGIAAADHAAIFEEYRQSGDLTVSRGGTGLGLAITRRLVRMHSGYIEVESQLGKGSRFTIVLPTQPVVDPRPDLRPRSIPPPAPNLHGSR